MLSASIPAGPYAVGRVAAFDGSAIHVTGLCAPVGNIVEVDEADGQPLPCETVGFRDDRLIVMPLGHSPRIAPGARVRSLGRTGSVACGDMLLGRLINGEGKPADGMPASPTATHWPLSGKTTGPLGRSPVVRPFDCGVRAINALFTCGEGQRVALVAGSGVGKSTLVQQMMAGSRADAVVVGLIGERAREVAEFVEEARASGAMDRTAIVAVTADCAPILRLRGAMTAIAIAEEMRSRGKRVLLIIDSLTRVAHAQREIGLALGEPPTVRGYPPSALGLIPTLVERAGNDPGGGSITAFFTILADGDDLDDPVVDSARGSVDGHIILSRDIAESGVFPAIDCGRSLSRVMDRIVTPDHAMAARHVRRLASLAESQRELAMMGAYVSGADADSDRALAMRARLMDFIAQPTSQLVDIEASMAALAEFAAS